MVTRHEGVMFTGSFTFSSLAPDSEYEVRHVSDTLCRVTSDDQVMVQARSELGWSHQTQPFRFSTPR